MRIVFLSFLFVSAAANSANWIPLVTEKKSQVLVEGNSISKFGKYKKAWFEYSYTDEQKPSIYTGFKSFKSMRTLEYFSCDERLNSSTQQIYYSDELGHGTPVHASTQEIQQTKFHDVVPDTIGEIMLNYVCHQENSLDK